MAVRAKVLDAHPETRLVVELRFLAFGVAVVVLDLEPLPWGRKTRGRKARVTMGEYPTHGPDRNASRRPAGDRPPA